MKTYNLKVGNPLMQTSSPYPYPIGYNPSSDSDSNYA